MTSRDPPRLLDGTEVGPEVRSWLREARSETPDATTQQAMLAGLSLSASIATPGLGSTLRRVSTRAPEGFSQSVAWKTAPAVLKWGLGVLVSGTWLAVALLGLQSRSAQPKDPPQSGTTLLPAVTTPHIDSPKRPVLEASTQEARGVTRNEHRAPSSPRPSRGSKLLTRQSLTDEIKALEEVRVALDASNRPLALSRLRNYAEKFPEGALGPEADTLRKMALALVESKTSDEDNLTNR